MVRLDARLARGDIMSVGRLKPIIKSPKNIEIDDREFTVEQGEFAPLLFVCSFLIFFFVIALSSFRFKGMINAYNNQMKDLREVVNGAEEEPEIEVDNEEIADSENIYDRRNHVQTMEDAKMLPEMEELYDMNSDIVGWLKIDDMKIDYPVMQTKDDEEYYLNRDFQQHYSANGSLILDTDSEYGSGTKENAYQDGILPSTNLIIHGHNMRNGDMFGTLDYYREVGFMEKHKTIKLTTLKEEREYEIISVFLSQVYLKSQTDVFKYYKFFDAYDEDEFNNFYDNIKELSLFDTGTTAKFGDEFITLSVCAYHVENGRLVVVGKRIK